uniref:Pancreatic trypsin inhibitor n=1 Tax=Rhipicephalus appendiculatus TaxID=34631 RepID=A0A131YSD7_RHIAP
MKPKASVFLLLACVIRVHGFLETKPERHPCLEKRETGPCRASVPSWYFDVGEGICKEFVYGGCKGNGNRFESKQKCVWTCSRFIGMKNITSTCMKKPDPGPCRAYIIRWFYDKNHHVCKTFVYGGCQGNSNSFATEQKCQATCMPTSTDQGTCSIDPKPRPCNARAQLWYFDHEENACRRFTAGFCGSSANKFATCRKCMNRCSSADAHKACSLAYKKIHYRKYGISWPGEMEPRVRGPSSLMDSLNNFTKPTFGFPGEVGRTVESSGVGSSMLRPSSITSGPTNSAYGGSTSNIGPGATGPHMTVAVGTVPSLGQPLPSSPIIPSITGSGLSSPMPSGTTPFGSALPGSTVPVPGTIDAGRTPAATVERASSLKSPPLTIPSYLLNGF